MESCAHSLVTVGQQVGLGQEWVQLGLGGGVGKLGVGLGLGVVRAEMGCRLSAFTLFPFEVS